MKPHVSVITLGVEDLDRAARFYRDGLGWPAHQEYPGWIALRLGGGAAVLGLMSVASLAADAGVPADGGSGFRGATFSYVVRSDDRVAEVLAEAEKAGAIIIKPAEQTPWGGCGGTFADPDGHVWKVASGTGDQPYAE